ncbi:MAG TPA: serine hydrolase domain-containing protein [Acidimicrobiales bacterium]|nr:serine hydrolase domain-containing protein [Acidimicrobiales bacterium]
MAEIQGEVAPGFEAVRDAFQANFDQHGDVGAAFALYKDGEKVVDLWGGVANQDTGAPWVEDTLQLVFSTTKGATAICAHLLAQRGDLDFDAPVAEYWPEFKANGKENVPVRWLLSHRVGLPVLDTPLTPEEYYAWEPVAQALAAKKPEWEPGTKHGYHAVTYGNLVGEVVKRISGKSLGTFFRENVAEPLGLDFWIGLPASEEPRVTKLISFQLGATEEQRSMFKDFDISTLPEEMRPIVQAFMDPNSLSNRALTGVTDPPMDFNSRANHAAEIPAANGITTARSLAKMYAAQIGEVDGVRLMNDESVANAIIEQSNGPDAVLMIPTRFGLGFFLESDFSPLFGPRSFGHAGAGGSLGFADPDAGIGYGYVMNKMSTNLSGDPRTIGLVDAIKSCI